MAKQKETTTVQTKPEFRTPIVAVMGHVDHGKTTLLDSLRGARVVDTEAGGITQNTRAHQIVTKHGHKITFIDTPGHEAFSSMRSRGAQVTDFVLLVVAADDGLQPQTIESIKFAQETQTPIIVAVNKIDLGVKSLVKLKKQLADHGVAIEEYGGDTMLFEISALKKTGLEEMLEGIELLAEIHALKSNELPNPNVTAQAFVLESKLDRQIGSVALCILKAGKLVGRETVITPKAIFRARAYLDEFQKPLTNINESDPFWVTGLKEPLSTGESIYFTDKEKLADKIQDQVYQAAEVVVAEPEGTAEELLSQLFMQKMEEGEVTDKKTLSVIVKSSTQGTLEAVINELMKLSSAEAELRILDNGVGEVTEQDVHRAKLAHGIVLSFQMPPAKKITDMAKQERVLVRNYEVIYEMLNEVQGALAGLLEPKEIEVEVARATVKQVFKLTNGDIVAGSEVTKGIIIRGYNVWVERRGEIIGRGKISSLKHFKEEVKEAKKGFECGIIITPPVTEMVEGDDVVAYKVEKT